MAQDSQNKHGTPMTKDGVPIRVRCTHTGGEGCHQKPAGHGFRFYTRGGFHVCDAHRPPPRRGTLARV
jgi:hypothetical protein